MSSENARVSPCLARSTRPDSPSGRSSTTRSTPLDLWWFHRASLELNRPGALSIFTELMARREPRRLRLLSDREQCCHRKVQGGQPLSSQRPLRSFAGGALNPSTNQECLKCWEPYACSAPRSRDCSSGFHGGVLSWCSVVEPLACPVWVPVARGRPDWKGIFHGLQRFGC